MQVPPPPPESRPPHDHGSKLTTSPAGYSRLPNYFRPEHNTGDMASADAEKTEMKIEGAVEAAQDLYQDPQSHVNPDTVEEKVVEDARNAGVAAYQFDPNASPQDKANAAKGVRVRKMAVFRAIA